MAVLHFHASQITRPSPSSDVVISPFNNKSQTLVYLLTHFLSQEVSSPALFREESYINVGLFWLDCKWCKLNSHQLEPTGCFVLFCFVLLKDFTVVSRTRGTASGTRLVLRVSEFETRTLLPERHSFPLVLSLASNFSNSDLSRLSFILSYWGWLETLEANGDWRQAEREAHPDNGKYRSPVLKLSVCCSNPVVFPVVSNQPSLLVCLSQPEFVFVIFNWRVLTYTGKWFFTASLNWIRSNSIEHSNFKMGLSLPYHWNVSTEISGPV